MSEGLELLSIETGIVFCSASSEALDSLPAIDGIASLRVAPDEVMLVGHPEGEEPLVKFVDQHFSYADPDGLTLNLTHGWSCFALSGPARKAAFARLSIVPLPTQTPGFAQGSLVSVSGKIFCTSDRIYLFVSSSLDHHLRDRALELCGDLGLKVGKSVSFCLSAEPPTAPTPEDPAVGGDPDGGTARPGGGDKTVGSTYVEMPS